MQTGPSPERRQKPSHDDQTHIFHGRQHQCHDRDELGLRAELVESERDQQRSGVDHQAQSGLKQQET